MRPSRCWSRLSRHRLAQSRQAHPIHARHDLQDDHGDIEFGPDGEWKEPRILTIQYQGVNGNDLAQFEKPGVQVILDPPAYKTGTLKYPYTTASK
jgi:hypothetical protein